MVAPPIETNALAGTRMLVTGASSGVGLELARCLAAAGAGLVLPVRDRERGELAAQRIRANAPDASIELRDLDLSSLDTVRALVAAMLAEDHPLDHLVLNAGIALVGERQRRATPDGCELHFQTNFLGHAALVLGLLPLLRRSRTRVVVQGSVVSAVRGVNWDDLQFERRYGPLRAYGSSKTALGLFAVELARREDRISVAMCHPGIVPDTGIAPGVRQRVVPALRDAAVRRLGNRPATAAEPALRALTMPAGPGSGSTPLCVAPSGWLQLAGPAADRRPYRRLVDPAAAARVWALAEELLGRPPAA